MTVSAASVRATVLRSSVRRGRVLLPFLPFIALLGLVLGAPLWQLFQYAFADGMSHWGEFFDDRFAVDGVIRTLVIAAEVTAVCIVLGYLYAGALLRAGPRWRAVLLVATLLPFLTSILVRTYGWIVILGNEGPLTSVYRDLGNADANTPFIYNRLGVLIGMVHVLFPLFVLPLYAVMSQIPDSLRRAARTLGANPVEAYLRVDMRLSLPGAAAGALLVFVTSLGFFITPALLGGPGDTMVSQLIDEQLKQNIDLNAAAVLGVVLLVAVLLCVLAFRAVYPIELLFVQSLESVSERRARERRPGVRRRALRRVGDATRRPRLSVTAALSRLPWGPVAGLAGVLIAVYFVAPLAIVVPVSLSGEAVLQFPPDTYSFRWYDEVLSDSSWRTAALNSLIVGVTATLIACAVGLPLAFVLVRSRLHQAIKGWTVFLAALPVVFPLVVLALAVFVWYLELRIVGDLLPLAAAHALLGLPFLLVIVMAALRDFDIRLERAARSLGASQAKTLRRVTLPLLRRAIAAGLLFAFLQSFDELLIARNVTNVDTVTLPVKIWDGANEAVSPALGAVSVLFIGVALLALVLVVSVQRVRERRSAP